MADALMEARARTDAALQRLIDDWRRRGELLHIAEEQIEALSSEIERTRERLDELDEPNTPLYDFLPQLVDRLFHRVHEGDQMLAKVAGERDAARADAQLLRERAQALVTALDASMAFLGAPFAAELAALRGHLQATD